MYAQLFARLMLPLISLVERRLDFLVFCHSPIIIIRVVTKSLHFSHFELFWFCLAEDKRFDEVLLKESFYHDPKTLCTQLQMSRKL